jgi:hypothetical protein
MPTAQDFFRSATIILFASGIVAIGADELYRTHRVKDGSRSMQRKEQRMVQELSGPDVKARMAPERVQRSVDERSVAGQAEKAKSGSAAGGKDSLNRDDRSELNGLLDSLIK